MRDYSFGNFISTLRERGGLSQYQLGVLVGVSDKAVSKWENGVSKPRIDTIRKLSEVLDISVDELLTCEYTTFQKRKDLFAMKNEIIKKAKVRMNDIYGDEPAFRIINRFKVEELALKDREILLWMGFLGELNRRCQQEKIYMGVRGAQIGASFIAWLLGGTDINPLPVHYHCPKCKRIEFIDHAKCGIDLPDKMCSCGERFIKDGFNVDYMNMYPINNNNEVYVSAGGTNIVKKCMSEYFGESGEVKELNIIYDGSSDIVSDERLDVVKFVLLSKSDAKKTTDPVVTISIGDYIKKMNELPVLTVVENINETVCKQDMLDVQYTPQLFNEYFDYLLESKKLYDKCEKVDLGEVFLRIEPSFSDLIAINGLLHGTGVWKDNGENLYAEGITLNELITNREDLYSYLFDKLNGVYGENPSGQVFEIKECVRKGRYNRKGMSLETETLMLENGVPKWYVESMKKIKYLFPKTHMIPIIKLDICRFVKQKSRKN